MSPSAPPRPPSLLAAVTVTAVTGLAIAAMGAPPASAASSGTTVPKNVILLISDGAGYNQFDIASLYESGSSYRQVAVDPATGAVAHQPGEATQVYEDYPVQVSQSHYSTSGSAGYTPEQAWGDFGWVSSGATDSAAAATALGTGVKTANGTIGFAPGGDRLLTVGEQGLAVGKKVGLVTSVPFNHATPAGFIAHNADRNDYHGLATEMIDSGIDVVIGGGHPNFTDDHTTRSSFFGAGSWISQADFDRLTTGRTPFTYVETRAGFEAVAAGTTVPDKLFGLAQVSQTLQYNRSGLAHDEALPYSDPRNDVPDLATLATAAINVLERDEDGFFLMVEGGAVDWAGHANQTTRVIEEQIDFNAAVEAVDAWVEAESSWDETLVIVTADHETGYLSGPGADPTWMPMTGAAGELPQVSWHSGNHTNSLVPFYAKGAGSELLAANADQWDTVRGAYLDNTEVGETIFDLLGHAPVATADTVGVEVTVPLETASGALSLTVPASARVGLEGDASVRHAVLPQVTVTDTRSEVQARGDGWTLAGTGSDFVAGNRSFGAENLSWTPRVLSSENGAASGTTATLEAPASLADSDRVSRVGRTVVDADLRLDVPTTAEAGRYGGEIRLTLFPKD